MTTFIDRMVTPVAGRVASSEPNPGPGGVRVAYIMSRFPTLRETFVLYEMLAVEEAGLRVDIYPLIRQREALVHPEAAPLVERAHYLPYLSVAVIRTQLYFLRRRPRAYLGSLADLTRATFGSRNYFLGGLAIFPKVVHAARMMEADGVTHVHCHFANHPTTAGFLIHRLTGIPYSFTAHAFDIQRDHHMLCRKMAEASFVVTISEFNRRAMRLLCPGAAEATEVIRCGVDTAVLRPRVNDRYDRGPHRVLSILCVGGLEEGKGQRHLVEACRILADEGVEFVCRLVGDGPDRHRLFSQVRAARLGERVQMLGPQARSGVLDLMGRADVLVAPSVPNRRGEQEGIPVVLMEAMAIGVPVIASDLSGIPELVKHDQTGTLVPPGQPEALAAALRQLWADPERANEMTQRARAAVLSGYDLRSNAARLVRGFTQGRLT